MKFAVVAVTLLLASLLVSVVAVESSEGLRARLAVRRGHLRGRSEVATQEKVNSEETVNAEAGVPEEAVSLSEVQSAQNGFGYNPMQINNMGNALNGGGNAINTDPMTLLLLGLLGINAAGNVLNSGGNVLNSGGNALNSGGNLLNGGGNLLNSGGNALNSGGNALNSGGNALNSGGNALNSLFNEIRSELRHGTIPQPSRFLTKQMDKSAFKNNPMAQLLFLSLLSKAYHRGTATMPAAADEQVNLEVTSDEAQSFPSEEVAAVEVATEASAIPAATEAVALPEVAAVEVAAVEAPQQSTPADIVVE